VADQKFQIEYQRLNQVQKEAVSAIEGPVMVIAGPGTGKTQIIALRIANILQKTQINPSNILALTFTESGAITMKKRLADIIGVTAYFVPIFTFHAFCNQIIKDYPDKFIELRHSSSDENGEWNLNELQVLSDIERFQIFENLIDNLPLKILRPIKAPYHYLKEIIKNIQNLKKEGITVSNFENILNKEKLSLNYIPQINE
jgi:DNA helicase-2/ATP-dependent DNA helicase PcrA